MDKAGYYFTISVRCCQCKNKMFKHSRAQKYCVSCAEARRKAQVKAWKIKHKPVRYPCPCCGTMLKEEKQNA